MAKLLSRLFNRSSSFHGSQSSLSDNQSRNKTSSSMRSGGSMENLWSYHINSKELEKNKLHKASWDGNLHKVERFAQPGQINLKDPKGRTSLHLAVVKGHLGIVRYLVQRDAKLDLCDADQRTPLIKAVLSGTQNPQLNLEICKILMTGGAGDSINILDKDGQSALHYAILYGSEDLVELFLAHDNCDPNLKSRDQMTPLHLAIKRNSPRIVQLLFSDKREQQADPNITNRYGQTPLHVAASVGYVEIVRLLLTANLSEPCDLELVDSQQLTALQAAKANHQEDCIKLIEEYQQHRFKPNLQRQTTISIHEQISARINNSISMTPAVNLEHDHDDTSDDSTSVSMDKLSKSLPRRTKRQSDQWSDDHNSSFDHTKSDIQRIEALFKNNPIQPEQTKKMTPSTLSHLLNTNPLQAKPKKTPATIQQTNSGPFYGIGPVIERIDSDNTSTSVSIKKPIQPLSQSKLATVPNVKSWSDDTTSALPIKQKVEPRNNSWDTSLSDEDDLTISKSKELLPKNIQKPQPLSTSIIDVTSSDTDDDNSVDTKIRKLDIDKPLSNKGIENLVNKQIGNTYKTIGVSEIQSPISEDSSWSTPLTPFNQSVPIKSVANIIPPDDSTWDDDSRPLTNNLSPKIGIDNLMKITNDIMQIQQKSIPRTVIGKLIVSSMADRTESISSEINRHNSTNERNKSDDWSMSTTTEKKLKPFQSFTRDSHSTFPEAQLKELKESIKRLEENQDDTRELKRQLHKMENEKNNFEKLYHDNNSTLHDIKTQFEHEKFEKQRLETMIKNLNDELKIIREKLNETEEKKKQLNQRCLQLEHERDQQLNQFHTSETTHLQSYDEQLEKIQKQYQEDLKILSDKNKELQREKNELQTDIEYHKDTNDVTNRYKFNLQKLIDEKLYFQHQFDRLKQENERIEQERLEYKIKYDNLQDEMRIILSDRSKLEQKLTEELKEHFHEKQQSNDHTNQYRYEIEQLNLKLADAEAHLNQTKSLNKESLQPTISTSLNIIHDDNNNNSNINRTYSRENYLIENSRILRTNTEQIKTELDHLRDEFDRLVSNYEPTSNIEQQQTELRLKIETFRQYYEQEFRQRQIISTNKLRTNSPMRLFPTKNERNLSDLHSSTIHQLPRRASALLTMNTSNNTQISSIKFQK